ncbi:MAG: HAD family hydrolase [Saprospiraceae bacterium]
MEAKIPFNWPKFKFDSTWSLFLDRDGVINRRRPDDYVKTWEEFIFLPGVLNALEVFAMHFRRIFIVTNQAGIEKGILSHEILDKIHQQMLETIQYQGGRVDEIYYCPYTGALDPLCRKPNPGMALEAKKDFPDIDFKHCIMIGDSDSDIIFGNNLGMKTILVGDKSGNQFLSANATPDCRMDSLSDFARYISNM